MPVEEWSGFYLEWEILPVECKIFLRETFVINRQKQGFPYVRGLL